MPLTRTFYVGTDCGLAVSNDDGVTWTNQIPAQMLPDPLYSKTGSLGSGNQSDIGRSRRR